MANLVANRKSIQLGFPAKIPGGMHDRVRKYYAQKYFVAEPSSAAGRPKVGGGGAPMPAGRRLRRVQNVGDEDEARCCAPA